MSQQYRSGMLGIYGIEVRQPYHRLGHWKATVDLLAEFKCNTWLFWVAGGVFKSKKFPSSDVYVGRGLGRHLPLTSEDDFRTLIRYGRNNGVDIFLGTGVFYWDGVQDIILNKYPHLHAEGTRHKGLMCLSKPQSARIMADYLWEMAERFPEAAGLSLEVADEIGWCQCSGCKEKYPELELRFLKDFLVRYWKKYPDKKVIWFAGYNCHQHRPDYYDELRRLSLDRRFFIYWVRTRNYFEDRHGRKHWFQDPATYREFGNNLLCATVQPGKIPLFEPEFVRLLKEANISGWINGCQAHKPGNPYENSWYACFPPQWKKREGIDWFTTNLNMFLYRTTYDTPGISEPDLLRNMRHFYFNDKIPGSLSRHVLDLYRFAHSINWWLARDSLVKDSNWCRSGGKWHFYFGYPEFGNKMPASTSTWRHPSAFVSGWKKEGRVPEEWIGFYIRLARHREKWLAWIQNKRRLFEKYMNIDDSRCSRSVKMIIAYLDYVIEDLLFISPKKSENVRYDGFMQRYTRNLEAERFAQGISIPSYENIVTYDPAVIREMAFKD